MRGKTNMPDSGAGGPESRGAALRGGGSASDKAAGDLLSACAAVFAAAPRLAAIDFPPNVGWRPMARGIRGERKPFDLWIPATASRHERLEAAIAFEQAADTAAAIFESALPAGIAACVANLVPCVSRSLGGSSLLLLRSDLSGGRDDLPVDPPRGPESALEALHSLHVGLSLLSGTFGVHLDGARSDFDFPMIPVRSAYVTAHGGRRLAVLRSRRAGLDEAFDSICAQAACAIHAASSFQPGPPHVFSEPFGWSGRRGARRMRERTREFGLLFPSARTDGADACLRR